MRSSPRAVFLAFLCVALALGCGSDKSTNPGGNGGGGGGGNSDASQFQSAIQTLYDQYLATNAVTYASLGYLAPFIAASLGSSPALATSGVAQVTCFSGAVGTTYTFNGTTYEASPHTGAPSNGARYVLYRLVSGQPNLADSIGYLEVTCSIVSTNLKSVGMSLVGEGVGAMSVSGTASESGGTGSFLTDGYLQATGAPALALTLHGQFDSQASSVGTSYQNPSVQIDFGTTDSVVVGRRSAGGGLLWFESGTTQWQIIVQLIAEAIGETIVTGGVYYGDFSQGGAPLLVACATGGTLSQPTYGPPDEACNLIGFAVGAPMSSSDLAAVTVGYQRLLELHELLADLAVRAFGFSNGGA